MLSRFHLIRYRNVTDRRTDGQNCYINIGLTRVTMLTRDKNVIRRRGDSNTWLSILRTRIHSIFGASLYRASAYQYWYTILTAVVRRSRRSKHLCQIPAAQPLTGHQLNTCWVYKFRDLLSPSRVSPEMLNEAKSLRPRSRPEAWGRGQGKIYRGRTEQYLTLWFNSVFWASQVSNH